MRCRKAQGSRPVYGVLVHHQVLTIDNKHNFSILNSATHRDRIIVQELGSVVESPVVGIEMD